MTVPRGGHAGAEHAHRRALSAWVAVSTDVRTAKYATRQADSAPRPSRSATPVNTTGNAALAAHVTVLARACESVFPAALAAQHAQEHPHASMTQTLATRSASHRAQAAASTATQRTARIPVTNAIPHAAEAHPSASSASASSACQIRIAPVKDRAAIQTHGVAKAAEDAEAISRI